MLNYFIAFLYCSEPNYYDVIDDPIDMNTIEKKIASSSYRSIDAFDEDFNSLFNNVEVTRMLYLVHSHTLFEWLCQSGVVVVAIPCIGLGLLFD